MKNDKQLDYLKVVLLGQLTIEAIEDLQGTNKYRQNLKNQGNKFIYIRVLYLVHQRSYLS